MKITIDTQHDTYDDIKKVLHILGGIIEKKELGGDNSSYASSSPTPTDTTNLMSMFDSSSSAPAQNVPNSPPDFSSFLNLTASKSAPEKRVEQPQIEVY